LPQIITLSKSAPFNPENDSASLMEFFGNEESDLIREYLSSLAEKMILLSINTAQPEHFSKVMAKTFIIFHVLCQIYIQRSVSHFSPIFFIY